MKYLNWISEVIFYCIIFICHVQSEISNITPVTKTNFSCLNKTAGFYADVSSNCKIYHTCDDYGNKFTYHCPEETAFRQDALICDHAHLVHCYEHTAYNLKYNEEEKNRNSSVKDLIDKKQFVFRVTQSPEANNRERYGFVLGTKERSAGRVNEISSTTSLPANQFIEGNLQHVFLGNNTQGNGSIKNEDSSVKNKIFNGWNKFNEKSRVNQKDYLNREVNNASNNFMKISRNIFVENVQTQKNNTKNDQIIKNTTNFTALPFINDRTDHYLETLKSIQKNRQSSTIAINTRTDRTLLTTTELPVYALTLSLKPLKPSELEYDPYYPKLSTSTEAYYTPVYNKEWSSAENHTQTTWSSIHFKFPSTLPDLNPLEDIVDRRKLLYIPRMKFN